MTAYMGLTLPGVLGTAGPTYATQQNADMSLIDAHDHTSGKGALVPTAGLNINADLSYSGFGPIAIGKASFSAISAPGVGNLLASLYVVGDDLYYQNGSGTDVQLTSGSTIGPSAATASNGFTASPGSFDPGQALFNTAAATYEFYTAAGHGTLAYMYADRLILKRASAGLGLTMATGGTSVTPTGGWALGNAGTTSRFDIAFDPLSDGSYGVTALTLKPNGVGDQYYLGVNVNAPAWAMDLHYQQAGNTVPVTMGVMSLGATAGGAVSTGFGPRLVMRANTTSASPTNWLIQGSINGAWGTGVGGNGGIRIHGAGSGTLSTTAGIEVMNTGGSDCVGIGGAATSSYTMKVYGTLNSTGVATVLKSVVTSGQNVGIAGEQGLLNVISNSVVFNGGTAAILNQFNVASVVRNAAGDYTITWTRTLSANAVFIAVANTGIAVAQVGGGAGTSTLHIQTAGGVDDVIQIIATGGF